MAELLNRLNTMKYGLPSSSGIPKLAQSILGCVRAIQEDHQTHSFVLSGSSNHASKRPK
jgi:hypothetical protein